MKLNLDDWTYIFTFGERADVYAKDNQRVILDNESKEVVCQYVFRNHFNNKANNTKGSKGLK